MGTMAKMVLILNLGADSEVRVTGDGTRVLGFRGADSYRSTRDGEEKEIATWYSISGFGEKFAKLAPYLKKGSLVYVEGRPSLESYKGTTRIGVTLWAIRLLGRKPASTELPASESSTTELGEVYPFDDASVPEHEEEMAPA